ncbi:MAG TPA: thioredoxin family protein, partial [Pirellulales bacterium]|nr:thioredoxin family protein [Pirellulales bacterium]
MTRQFAAMLVLGITAPCLGQNALRWENSLAEAQRVAAATNRLVIVHFSATWCQPCQRLEKQVFSQPGFGQSLAERFVAVKLDFDENPELAGRWGVQVIPTDVILSPDGQPIQRMQSPPTADAYVSGMQRAADYAMGGVANNGAASTLGDRYANYNASQAPQQPPSAQTHPAPPASSPDWKASSNDPVAGASPVSERPVARQVAASTAQTTERRPDPSAATNNAHLPPDCPRLGLDGFCPVTLMEKRAWTPGDARWGAIHRNRTYLFCSEAEQK